MTGGTSPRRPLHDLSWHEFELAMADAFRAQGYLVTVTPDGADGGVDLVLDRGDERTLVQCKHWGAWTVGVQTVRELYGVMAARHAPAGIVATTGRFSHDARAFAHEVGIRLLDGPAVARMLGVPWTARPAPPMTPGPPADADGGPPRCPRCGELMTLRTARKGPQPGTQFWGCPRYPACHGKVAGAVPGNPPPVERAVGPRERGRDWRLVAMGVVAFVVVIPVLASAFLQAVRAPVTQPPMPPAPIATPGDASPTSAAATAVRSLPAGSWIAVLESLPKGRTSEAEALLRAEVLDRTGRVVVVDSDAIPGLNPGYWALAIPGAQSEQAARASCAHAGRSPGPSCYPRGVR